MRGKRMLRDLGQDISYDFAYALRGLRRNTGLTAVAVVSLSVGIAACAFLGALGRNLLESEPYVEPARLALVYGTTSLSCSQCVDLMSRRTLSELRGNKLRGIELLAGFREDQLEGSAGANDTIGVAYVDSEFFKVLGARTVAGRVLNGGDMEVGIPNAVVSYGYWKTHLAGDRRTLGNVVRGYNRPFTIVGVLPAGFRLPATAEVWLPSSADPTSARADDATITGVARLSSAADVAGVSQEIAVFARRRAYAEGDTLRSSGLTLIGHSAWPSSAANSPLWLIGLAVMATFGIVCFNLANLFYVQSLGRRREFEIRFALGATFRRVIRQTVTEALLFASTGAAIAGVIICTTWPIVNQFCAGAFGITGAIFVDVWTVLAASAATCAAAAIIALAPMPLIATVYQHAAWRSIRGNQIAHQRVRRAFVLLQVATALVLLIGSELLIRSFIETNRVDLGFDAAHVLVSEVRLDSLAGGRGDGQRDWARRVAGSLTAETGSRQVGLWSYQYLDKQNDHTPILATGDNREILATPNHWPRRYPIESFDVSPAFFQALGVTLLAGRVFTDSDRFGSDPVAVVNQAAAAALWPGKSAVGQRIKLGGIAASTPWLDVVGVVANTSLLQKSGLGLQLAHDGGDIPLMFRPYDQAPSERVLIALRSSDIGSRQRQSMTKAISAASPPGTALTIPEPMRAWMAQSPRIQRISGATQILTLLASVSILITLLGVYGLMSASVRGRVIEIGVRMAVGADARTIATLFAREVAGLATVGLSLGLIATAILVRLSGPILYGFHPRTAKTGLLFGVSAADPRYYLGAVVLVIVSMFAAAVIDPADVLRAGD